MLEEHRHELQWLEQELAGEGYRTLLQKLQQQSPFWHRFQTWEEVLACMHRGTSQDPLKDEVLRPIFRAHSEDEDPRWRTILLAVFWPSLKAIHRKLRHWDPDPQERWQSMMWNFLRTICRIDIQRRPDRLFRKVLNDTVHRLHDEYLRVWEHMNREHTKELEEIEALAQGREEIADSSVEPHGEQPAIERLQTYLAAGWISEADFLLLVGTRVYGKSMAEYARETGLSYQATMKRRQRAEAAIRKRLEKQ